MLQWMGGSRRKVNASRNSNHNRQKQYFEQRKRQQQTAGENGIDARNKCANFQEEPRSLDILSLLNLETVAQQDYPMRVNEVGVSQETSHVSKLSPAVALKKIISDLEERRSAPVPISPKKSCAATCPEDVPSAYKCSSKLDRPKIPVPPSNFAFHNTGVLQNQQIDEAQNFLDLLSDEGPRSNSEGKLVPESHVAFSVKGLGNIGVETPAQSPNLNDRGSPPLPKASKQTSSVKLKSILLDLGLESNGMMNDVKMSDYGSFSEILPNSMGIPDDVGTKKGTKFVEISMHPFDSNDQIGAFDANDEDIYSHMGNRKGQRSSDRFGILSTNFLNEGKCKTEFMDKLFYTEKYSSIWSRDKNSEYDFSFADPDLLNSRIAENSDIGFDISGKASSSPSLRHLTSDKDYKFVSVDYDCERYHVPMNRSNFEAAFDPHDWSFLANQDVEDSMSLLSEESCSSTAVRKEKRYDDLGSHSVKVTHNQSNCADKSNLRSKWKYDMGKFAADGTFYTGISKSIHNGNPRGTGNCKSGCKRSFEASDFSPEYCAYQGTQKPKCTSLFDEEYTSLKADSASSSHRRTSKQSDTRSFNCKLLSEDNLFDLLPNPKLSPDIDFTYRSKFNIPINHEPSDNFIGENEISRPTSSYDVQLQKPAKHPSESESESCLPNSSCAWDFRTHTKFTNLEFRKHVRNYKEDASRNPLEKPHYDTSTEKKSLSSANSGPAHNADCSENCKETDAPKGKTHDSVDRPEFESPEEEAEGALKKLEEVSSQIQTCVDDNQDQSVGGSAAPSQVGKKDFRKEKSGAGADLHDARSKGGSSSDASYQVMLERYVLQFLCVQKILMGASEKEIGKKIITWKEDLSVDLVSFGTPHH